MPQFQYCSCQVSPIVWSTELAYRLSTFVTTLVLQSLFIDESEVSMPCQEVTSAVDRSTVIGVNDNEVVKSGLGSWVESVVYFRRLGHQALNGTDVGLAL